ncbi:biliverdin reductase A-like, partial [Argonauta hians]
RQLNIDLTALTLEDALNRSDVHIFIICTEAAAHEDTVRKCLEGGKHVLVEYPVATTAETAKQLYRLASNKGLVLHEENIGLNSLALLKLKRDVDENSPLEEVRFHQKVYLSRVHDEMCRDKKPFTSNPSMFKCSLFLFKSLTCVGGEFKEKDGFFEAVSHLRTADNRKVEIKLSLVKEKGTWDPEYCFKFQNGVVIDEVSPELVLQTSSGLGLFMEDLLYFSEKLSELRAVNDSQDLIIRSLELIDQTHRHM